MVYDKLENLKKYIALNPTFKTVVEFIENNNLLTLPLGKAPICDGAFYNRQEYLAKPEVDDLFESHLDYIDIQIVLDGVEKHYFSTQAPVISQVNEKDCYFTSAKKENAIMLNKGEFVIFFPNELHKPGLKVDDKIVQKVVFKVKG